MVAYSQLRIFFYLIRHVQTYRTAIQNHVESDYSRIQNGDPYYHHDAFNTDFPNTKNYAAATKKSIFVTIQKRRDDGDTIIHHKTIHIAMVLPRGALAAFSDLFR